MYFEKVSFEQYKNDVLKIYPLYSEEGIKKEYDSIQLPKRATSGSAGYDFYLPKHSGLSVETGLKYLIPTGIRVIMPKDVVLKIYPRSGFGTKYDMRLSNTVGIIDSDYAFADNEGHIMISIIADKSFIIKSQQGFAQGIFQHYLTVDDDEVTTERTGGFGSTDKK